MAEFAESVKDEGLREKLAIALDGKGAFRRFKNVLYNYPDEEKRWFEYKDKSMKREITEWLNDLGIEAIS